MTDNAWIVELYRLLRKAIRTDLIGHGFSNEDAGAILNWFSPDNPQYLERVDQWQRFLCRGVLVNGPSFIPKDDIGVSQLSLMDPVHVKSIHQVAKLVYKAHGVPAKETNWEEVAKRLSQPLPISLTDVEISGIRRCLSSIKPIDLNEVKGRFGPGATAEGFDAFEKWIRKGYRPDVPPNLYRANPRDDWEPTPVNVMRITKMAEVPKSIKCNRIVSSEPAMSMYAQLAINDELVRQIHLIFPGKVSLHDQGKHNRLLLVPGMATLDLSDASDHVSVQLVRDVLPQLWPVLAKVRSEYSLTPKGDVLSLATFAPMGAGFCFSVMTTVILGIIRYAFESFHYRWLKEPWSVYGDDIIVPVWIADYVIDLLERAGLVINHAKSCTSGLYVESCGRELFRGIDVTPGYIRDPLHTVPAEKVESIISQMRWCRYGSGEIYAIDLFPNLTSAVFSLAAPIRGFRFNKNLQEGELLVRTSSARAKLRHLDGYAGLNRYFAVGSQQEVDLRGNPEDLKIFAKRAGLSVEVWTKPAWRYRLASNYPNLMFMSGSHAILGQEDKQDSISRRDRAGKTSRPKKRKQPTDL